MDQKSRLIRGGPTIAAAIVCFVSGVFSLSLGLFIMLAPKDLQGIVFMSLTASNSPISTSSILGITSFVTVILGILYFAAGALLWSYTQWARGAYLGIVVSILGTGLSGLGVTFAPGAASAGLVINILIITMIATEAWEDKMLLRV